MRSGSLQKGSERYLFLVYAVILFSVLIGTMQISCTKVITIHPGAADAFDSQAYDRLLEAQAALNAAKAEFEAGRLPPVAKDFINAAGEAYNIARKARAVYHDTKGNRNEVEADLVNLTAEIAKVLKLGGKQP